MDECSNNEESAMNLCISNETFSNEGLDHYPYNNKITKIMQLSEDASNDVPNNDQQLSINNNNLTIKMDDSSENMDSSRDTEETSPTNFLLKKTLLSDNRKYITSKNLTNETAFLQKLQEQLQSNVMHNVDQAAQNQKFVEQFQILQKQYSSMQEAIINQSPNQNGSDGYFEKRLKNWNEYVKSCPAVFKYDTQDLIQCADSNDFSCDMKLSSDNASKLQNLYTNGICKWPGCDTVCDNYQTFIRHLSASHILDDKSMAQARIQMQVVTHLGLQLEKERDRLDAMMVYFDISKKIHDQNESLSLSNNITDANIDYHMSYSLNLNHNSNDNNENSFYSEYGPSSRRRSVDNKKSTTIHGGLPYMLERAGLDIHQEIQRNRDLYKTTDVRPPFTYASLIRQSILESTDKQLTLNEIYNWFQSTFCFFRRNAATWKNAIRTNLSLHKCFIRYEDDFGSFWMVDDAEFAKRRHLSRGRPRKYDPNSLSSSQKKFKEINQTKLILENNNLSAMSDISFYTKIKIEDNSD